jgi:hypothetical protein
VQLTVAQGILFLTTNRVGTFDPAFKSRIHISLYYPDLDRKATLAIWRMHLGRVKKAHGKHFIVNDNDIIAFAKDHYKSLMRSGSGSWNGRYYSPYSPIYPYTSFAPLSKRPWRTSYRQIRNAFQTAFALAEFEGKENAKKFNMGQVYVELKREHFKMVADASETFDHYLKVMFGGKNESEIAAQERIRAQIPTKEIKAVVKEKTVQQKKEDWEVEGSEGGDDDSSDDDKWAGV